MGVLKGVKILVVEDVEAERALITTFLHQQGCRVYHAHDGMDGVHKARLIVPDLILMDMDMPEYNGLVATKAISQAPATTHIPIIFLSAFATPEDKVQGLLAGAVDYIGKPFNFDEVKLRLAIHLRSPGPRATTAPPVEQEDTNTFDSVIFHSARVHLLKSLDRSPGLQELAELLGTNTKRLNASFKAYSGLTVYEYLREERMKEARELLVSSDVSISDVADRVGFSSSANFSTAFRERFDVSPSRFRKEQRTHV